MLKFFTTAGLFFGICLAVILGIYLLLTIGIRAGELMESIEEKYGFKGCIYVFLIGLAVISFIVAAILTFTGV
jgi:hypothetical protein